MGLFNSRKDDYDEGFGYTSTGNRSAQYNGYGQKRYDNADYESGSGYDLDGCEVNARGRRKKKKHGSTGKGIFIGILISAAVVAGAVYAGITTLSGDYGYTLAVVPIGTSSAADKLTEIQQNIESYFIFDYDETAASDAACSAYLEALDDPYTCYYTEEEYNSMMESTSGSYYGIGIMVSQNADTKEVTILQVFSDSPAQEAGLQPGDIIKAVAGEDVTQEDVNEVVAKIKGTEGSTVAITVQRGSDDQAQSLTFDVERRQVSQDTVYYEMMDNHTGYIQLVEFDSVSTDQFQEALDDLTAQGMTSLIVDLRSNPGGLLDTAVEIADMFIDTGKVVSITYKDGETEEYDAEEEGSLGIPVAVLVNGNSASASEVLSGCLKDYGAATLIGTQTYGKGIVQQIMPLSDGTAMKVTIAHYYTPDGNDIHGVGITPDIIVEEDENTEASEQLQAAWDYLNGKQ